MIKFLFFVIILIPTSSFAQENIKNSDTSFNIAQFTLSYNIRVKGNNISGLAETYNGGIQTIFVKDNLARIRLVSLMRIQSIFYVGSEKAETAYAVVTKESEKKRTKMILNQSEWFNYNNTEAIIGCDLNYSDTLTILNYLCNKAIIKQGKNVKLEVYYVPGIKSEVLLKAFPLFSCIPGLVLKYTYTVGSKMIAYTADIFNKKKLDPATFTIPTQGFQLKKYVSRSTGKK